MFPAALDRKSHVRRILIVSLAALLLFTVLAVAPGTVPAAQAGHPVDYVITFANDAETGAGPIVSGTGDQDGLTVTVEGETISNIHASCSDLFNLYTKVAENYIRIDPLPADWGYGESGNPQPP